MKSFLQKNHRILFYSCWIVLALLQSSLTELMDDEAYYWVYSKFPDWGYFDHPPMVAILIRAGYFLFQSELGVRLLFIFLNVLSLLLIEKLTEYKNPLLFYAIALSIAILQLGGFLAVPDTALIFFTALFLFYYKKFLRKASLLNTLLLGIAAAALLYSKYQGVLVIFFVLISNLKLFAQYQTYVAGLIALLIFSPHLWWQYQHNWISFRYHLFQSNVNPYRLSFTLDYLVSQVLLAGPLAGVILIPAAFLHRAKDAFERALKISLIGIYIFFFLSSFKGEVEANWTSPAIVPLMILGHKFLAEGSTKIAALARKWLWRLLPATMVLVLCGRMVMIFDILPIKAVQVAYHGWKGWPARMRQITGGLPVVMEDSYQRASKYWFYSGQMTYSLNHYRERRNNYDFWPIEDSLLGKAVYLLDIYNLDSFQTKMETGIGLMGYKYDPEFSSFAKVQFIPTQKTLHADSHRGNLEIQVQAKLPALYYNYIATHPLLETKIVAGVFSKKRWVMDLPVDYPLIDLVQGLKTLRYQRLNLPPDNYYLIFSILHIGTISPTHNSERITLIVR